MPPYYNSVTSCVPNVYADNIKSCIYCTVTMSYNYFNTTTVKENADAAIKRFYDKGYITDKEYVELKEKLSTINDVTIMIKVDVDNRTIMFCTGSETFSTLVVYTPNNDVDFTINYDSEKDEFEIAG